MTCQECELMLAEGRAAEVAQHLAACAECRALAEDLQANAEAFAAMREEVVPARPLVVGRRAARWPWAVAAAAALVIGIALMRTSGRVVEVRESPKKEVAVVMALPKIAAAPLERPKVVSAPRKRSPRIPAVQPAKAEPMLVKMLTSDPDVVIYWLVEAGE